METQPAIVPLLGEQSSHPHRPGDDPACLNSTVEPAPKEFGANERKYLQVWREADIAVLEARIPGGPITSYEVVIIRIEPAYERFGKSYPAKEHYPGNSDWGKSGWSFNRRHKEFAIRAAQQLVGTAKEKRRATIHKFYDDNKAAMRKTWSGT